jgi:DDE superfamily endonuclease
MWCVGNIDEEYVANMEDILSLYAEPVDTERPRLAFDERPILLVADVTDPLSMQPGQSKRSDYEYARLAPAVLLLAYNIDTGQRHSMLCSTKTKVDYAQFIGKVIKEHYYEAKSIRLVQDNLGTHTKGSFYKAFPAQEARDLAKKIEFHFTPKHASWLNMAEIEFSALSRQCLNRRFQSLNVIEKEIMAWEEKRNQEAVKIHWSFTVNDARDKLQRHYPSCSKSN